MKTWFCVTSSIDYSGRTTRAEITAARTAERRPKSGVTPGERENVYTDWFDGLEQAKAFIADVCPSALGRVTTNDIFMRMLDSTAKEMTT